MILIAMEGNIRTGGWRCSTGNRVLRGGGLGGWKDLVTSSDFKRFTDAEALSHKAFQGSYVQYRLSPTAITRYAKGVHV